MKTYENYYGITKENNIDTYNIIKERNVDAMLRYIGRTPDMPADELQYINWPHRADEYLSSIGVSTVSKQKLKEKLMN